MEDVEFLNQWEIDEEENQLEGTKKEITIAEEKFVAAQKREVVEIEELTTKEKQIKKD